MATIGECQPVAVGDAGAIADLANAVDADLTVLGAEVPLVAGAVDALTARGRVAFGPTAAGARLEGSKAWMKQLLADAGVPTAQFATFNAGHEAEALAFVETLKGRYVIKTDGLAAGKGVVVTESLTEARDAVRAYLSGAAHGDAGRTVVIEEALSGPELSLLVLCDGRSDPEGAIPLAPAQDFKRLRDGDIGPNTGGMGAYSPVPAIGANMVDEVMERAVRPSLRALARQGISYRGVLYAGIMLTEDGPKVLEYNVRFGDPECQVVIPRLTSDVAAHCLESATGAFETPVTFDDDACVTVVLAADGYPEAPRIGDEITGLSAAGAVEGVTVFHAGTALRDGAVVTAGGRVLNVTAKAATIEEARERAYRAVEKISWPGVQYRQDIAAHQ